MLNRGREEEKSRDVPGTDVRLVQQCGALGEEVRETDRDHLAVLHRDFLDLRQEHRQDLSEKSRELTTRVSEVPGSDIARPELTLVARRRQSRQLDQASSRSFGSRRRTR